MNERLRVAVVGGGQNSEHEVSLASAASARAALDPGTYETVALTILRDGSWLGPDDQPLGSAAGESLAAALTVLASCDVVLPLLHGPRGEDGTLAALCELAGVPYVGAPVRAGALAMDKWATKQVAEAVGVPTVAGELVTAADLPTVVFERPVVVKPIAAGSSFGVRLVETAEQLQPALRAALELDERVLVEHTAAGREIDLAVLDDPEHGRRVGPPLEILLDDGLFDNTTKYDGTAAFTVPAQLTDAESTALTESALRMYEALGCRGIARVDFFLTPEGPVLNEVNTMPGMTAESQVPKMFAAEGMTYPDLLDRLVRSSLPAGNAQAQVVR
ncbi:MULTISPECIES: D-alanine--D-alanine ligase family protein [unclassified Actinopolyspora]|uniref:D-alanine--D-alanine ligase family protein n=1 Tax=unclassified Actinopolyspora TaxID=2639451 RepID=UPI0013F5B56A|nr:MULTISPECIES: D-alanine--D-alanine ligase family protein [unclassified Actinopolyspora]NHD19418.1 D-alanine--D-alanine ligase [Actinopolyspora sp. BKK2]NHE78509.1 D-alanine--D-alanine ligase [Actinopolyspora sp. BKK1]